MKKEITVAEYNELCDRIRSIVLYTEAFRRKSKKREEAIQELIGINSEDEIKLVDRIRSLEQLINSLSK